MPNSSVAFYLFNFKLFGITIIGLSYLNDLTYWLSCLIPVLVSLLCRCFDWFVLLTCVLCFGCFWYLWVFTGLILIRWFFGWEVCFCLWWLFGCGVGCFRLFTWYLV